MWQKWVGKIAVFLPAVVKLVFDLFETGQPNWLMAILLALPGVAQWVLALIPPKAA